MLKRVAKHIDKFFRRFFLAYIVILMISIIAFFILYNRSSVIIEDHSIDRQITSLRQIRTRMDDNLIEIMTATAFAANNVQVRSLAHLEDPFSGTNVLRIRETMDILRNLQTLNPLVADFFVVFEFGDTLVAPHSVGRLEQFYPTVIPFVGVSLEGWRSLIFDNPFSRFVPAMQIRPPYHGGLFGTEQEVIQYVVPFTVSPGDKRGAAVSFINTRAIYNMFREAGIGDMGTVFIMSQTGEMLGLITGRAEIHAELYGIELPQGREGSARVDIDGYTYLVSHATSTFLGWTYVSVIRSDYVLAELNTFRQSLMLVAGIVLALTLILSVVFSWQHSKPIHSLQQTISGYMPRLRNSFLRDLFDGKYYESEDAKSTMKSLGLNLIGDLYMVAVVQVSAIDNDIGLQYVQNLEKTPVLIDAYASQHQSSGVKFHVVSSGRTFGILFVSNGTDSRLMEDYVIGLADWLANHEALSDIHIGVGGAYADIKNVHRSYTEAMEAVQYYMVLGSQQTICVFSDIPHKKEFYYYPEQEEQRLLNMVKSGDVSGVRTALNYICNENFTSRKLSNNMMVAFINHLWQGIVEIDRLNLIIDDSLTEKLNDSYETFYKLNDLQKLQVCTQFYLDICESLHLNRQIKAENFMTEITQYVEENYLDPDISLTTLADKYNFSETYLSQRFKEHTGENFYNHVQTLRINKAINLLETSNLTIQEISVRVGYSAYNTFAKAFKRITGVSAGEYRKNM